MKKPLNTTIKSKGMTSTQNKKLTLANLIKNGEKIKISKDTFFELYVRNGDVRSCVRDIAKRVGFNGIYLEDDKGDILEKKESKKIISIFSNPTFYNFKVDLFKNLMIAGECYIVPVWDGYGKTIGFRFLDPRTMVKFVNINTGEITKFEQRISGQASIQFEVNEISFYKFENHPQNEFEGLSILEGVIYDALTDKEAMERNYVFFENGMTPDSVIILDNEFGTDELEIAKASLEGQLKGTQNSHKTLITNAIKDIKTLSLSSKDIDFINQRKLTIEKVCSVFQVPRSILGYTDDINRSNGDTNYKQYILGTIRPYEQLLDFLLNELYAKFVSDDLINKGIEIECDGENVDDRDKIEENQRKDIEVGIISIDEAREERGKEAWGKKGLTDCPLISNNLQVLSENMQTPKNDTVKK